MLTSAAVSRRARRRRLTCAVAAHRSVRAEPHLPHHPGETREPRRRHLQRGVSPAAAIVVLATLRIGSSSRLRRHVSEKCVMNNYFGIGLDAKISLEFNNKRDEHPKKCR